MYIDAQRYEPPQSERKDVVAIQLRAIQSRKALIRSAAETFDEKGVMAAGMIEISARARLSKGALYFHFTSKEDLVFAVRDEVLTALTELEAGLTNSPLPARLAVRDFAIELLGRLDSDVVMRAGLQIAKGTSDGGGDLHKRWMALILARTTAEQSTEAAPEASSPYRTAQLLTSLLIGLLELGRENRVWWRKDTITGMWAMFPNE